MSWNANLVPSIFIYEDDFFCRPWGWSAARQWGSWCQGAELLLVETVLAWPLATLNRGEGGHGGTLDFGSVESDR